MAKTGEKGFLLEELLRAYFLRAGMYAVRGVPLQLDGDDLTDVDIWLYERPTGSSRRRQIVDAKSKLKPKAVERLLWTKGLSELLQVDGAYVATTDSRPMLKEMSARLGVSVLDGTDLKRMSDSEKILFADRLAEEELDKTIKAVDRGRRSKELQLAYHDLKSALIDNFGGGTVNRALDHVAGFAKYLAASHPGSAAAEVSLRLSYIAASVVAIALDAALAKVAFKSVDERRKLILNVIRYGNEEEEQGLEKVRVAAALVEQYAPNGRALSQSMLNAVREGYSRIPAEIIADHALTQLRNDGLFRMGRSLEAEAFNTNLRSFDALTSEEKSFLGVLLDFSGIDRASFANSWTTDAEYSLPPVQISTVTEEQTGSLFDQQ